MKVGELIKVLETMPHDAELFHLWDGEARTHIEHIWLSRDGDVITADHGMVCYSTETRPMDAPTSEEDRYWSTPKSDNNGHCAKRQDQPPAKTLKDQQT